MAGRPTLCTPERIGRIADGVALGMGYEVAAKRGGVSFMSLSNWRARGLAEREARKAGESSEREAPYLAFVEALEDAEHGFAAALLARIHEATLPGITKRTTRTVTRTIKGVEVTETTTEETFSSGLWAPAAWLLERRLPQDYARTTKQEVTGAGGGPLQHEAVDPSLSERMAAAATAYLEAHDAAGDEAGRERPAGDDPADAARGVAEPLLD